MCWPANSAKGPVATVREGRTRWKICCVAGARPNFLKIAPLIEQFRRYRDTSVCLIHTGQHYDATMSDAFFEELGIPPPDVSLGVGSGPHGWQTGRMMERLEPVLLAEAPDLVVVVGDVNSTLAAALVAVKLLFPVAHVEAGLRSFDRSMPEEINRVLTDALASLLFCTEPAAVENLKREGIAQEKIFLAGNVMIDSLTRRLERARSSDILGRMGLKPRGYAVLTLHRPSNVDREGAFLKIAQALEVICRDVDVVFPVHPRTRQRAARGPAGERLGKMAGLHLVEPLGYSDFLKLMMDSCAVLTDSGGIQEETTFLGIPCLTLRNNTERPITLEMGTNRLAGTEPDSILQAWRDLRSGRWSLPGQVPDLWDGRTAGRIVSVIRSYLDGGR